MNFTQATNTLLGANGPLETDVKPLLNHAAQQADDFLQSTAEALHQQRERLQERAEHTREQVSTYVREEPVKSLLMAAAAGAVLMGVTALLMRGRSHRDH